MSIYKKLLEVQKLSITVTKDSINPHFKNKYASLDKIIEAYTKPLSDNGLVVTHTSDIGESVLITSITDTEDESQVVTSFPLKFDVGPQQIGSQLTYAKRYNLGQLLNIATDEDDDGNQASKPAQAQPAKKPVKPVDKRLQGLGNKWTAIMGQGKGKLLEQRYKTVYKKETANQLSDDEILMMIGMMEGRNAEYIENLINDLSKAQAPENTADTTAEIAKDTTGETLPPADDVRIDQLERDKNMNLLNKKWIAKMGIGETELLRTRASKKYGKATANMLTDDEVGEMLFEVQERNAEGLKKFINAM